MIDSGNDLGHGQRPPDIPPPDIRPSDVANIYSWVTVQGSKYRDFSASRQEVRVRFHQRLLLKQRVEVARKAREQVASTQTSGPVRLAAGVPKAASPVAEAVQDPVQVPDPVPDSQRIPEGTQIQTPEEISESTYAPEEAVPGLAHEPAERARDEEEPLPSPNAPSAGEEMAVPEPGGALADEVSSQNEALGLNKDETAEVAEGKPETHKPDAGRDAEAVCASAEADALRRGKAGLSSRWFALRSVFARDAETRIGLRAPRGPVPALAIFSQAGGVGKTSLAATLGRILASRGEQVFLAETASPGLLPLFFGSREAKPGVVRTFSPPAGSDNAAVLAVTLDPRQLFEMRDAPDLLAETLLRYAHGSNRIVIDIQTGSEAVAHRVLPLAPMVLVPLLADMNSVMSLNAVEAVFSNRGVDNRGVPGGFAIEPVYLLNQFDRTLPLHVEVRELLQKQLGSRLLPFVVRRNAAVSEALAEGMTVVDYAPGSPVTEDYVHLANWLASAAPVAASGYSGLRWSER